MKKHWKEIVSGGLLLLSVVMMLLFPRENNLAAATVFAVLFWLSLIACVVLAVAAIRARGDPKADHFPADTDPAGDIKKSEHREEHYNEK